MNLNDLKVSGNNSVHVEDALPTSLLGLKITINDNTQIPTTNELNIYVDTTLKVNGIGNLSEDRVGDLYKIIMLIIYI